VFEVNTNERRQGKQLLDRLQEAAICSQVGRQRLDAAPATASPSAGNTSGKKRRSVAMATSDRRQSKRQRRDGPVSVPKVVNTPALSRVTVTNACLLLFDDADTLLEDEAGFHRLLALVCSVARKPALVTVRSAASLRRQAASAGSGHHLAAAPLFRLRPATPAAVSGFARLAAAALGWRLEADGAAALADSCGHRLGRLLHELHYRLFPAVSTDSEPQAVQFTLSTGEQLDRSPLARLSAEPLLLDSPSQPDNRLDSLLALADAADAGRLADRLRRGRRLPQPDCLADGVADELPTDGAEAAVDFVGDLGE
uniref:ATPase_AAA_core domain-containing protein n=2 Tax=Macrostomum lignano TaxID=282301 RepID=A0A1I8HZA5_9PLAT